jgi:hypothetical protein
VLFRIAFYEDLQFLENALVALPILRQLEQMRQSNEAQLQTSFDNYEKCSAIRTPTSCTLIAVFPHSLI